MIFEEDHQIEQYWFNDITCKILVDVFKEKSFPCFACAPRLGKYFVELGYSARILDIDKRFADVHGFHHWNIYRPETLSENYDVVFIDPPFYRVRLDQLFAAAAMLTRYCFDKPLAICYDVTRENNLLGTFAKFMLEPTGIFPMYISASPRVQVYANFGSKEFPRKI